MNLSWLINVVSGQQKGPFAAITRACLWGLTPVYRSVVRYRNRQFDSGVRVPGQVDAKVISIGNITTGGTGKTPMVIHICELLRSQNLRPAIVSRGYGAKDSQTPNDEAMELLARLPDVPHVQNPDRVAAAIECVVQHDAEVIVLDDGFQHRRIARDLDIVLIDASNPFGYGYVIPRGLLREPVSSLRRADVVVITRCNQLQPEQIDKLKNEIRQSTKAGIALARTRPVSLAALRGDDQDISSLSTGKWLAVSAIGNPSAFEESLKSLGCDLVGSIRFRDHHVYDSDDFQRIAAEASEKGAQNIICTHKDLVKLAPDAFELPVFALQMELEVFEDVDTLNQKVLEVASR